jgi:hypothetical protein
MAFELTQEGGRVRKKERHTHTHMIKKERKQAVRAR